MKRALVALATWVLAACSAPAPPTTTVEVSRTAEITMHGETDAPPAARAAFETAAERWRDFTSGNVQFTTVYDVNFDSVSNLRWHRDEAHNLILIVPSTADVVRELDAQHPTVLPLAATATLDSGAILVLLVGDRIKTTRAASIVTHEFGHVLGLPDLPTMGAVMSGAEYPTAPPIDEFTGADRRLCVASRYCAAVVRP